MTLLEMIVSKGIILQGHLWLFQILNMNKEKSLFRAV